MDFDRSKTFGVGFFTVLLKIGLVSLTTFCVGDENLRLSLGFGSLKAMDGDKLYFLFAW